MCSKYFCLTVAYCWPTKHQSLNQLISLHLHHFPSSVSLWLGGVCALYGVKIHGPSCIYLDNRRLGSREEHSHAYTLRALDSICSIVPRVRSIQHFLSISSFSILCPPSHMAFVQASPVVLSIAFQDGQK